MDPIDWEILTNPSTLFDNIQEVRDFLAIPATIPELEIFLQRCIDEELYLYCAEIKKKIDFMRAMELSQNERSKRSGQLFRLS